MARMRRRDDGSPARGWTAAALTPPVMLGLLIAACTAPGATPGAAPAVASATPAATAPQRTGSPAGPTAVPAGSALTQSSEGGQVTVKVTWQGASAGPVFKVVMDTHAVDLDGYDLRQTAVLRTGDGRELRPTGWDAPKGGHHREGLLTFPATTPDGTPVIIAGRTLELVIRDVAAVPERKFQWTA